MSMRSKGLYLRGIGPPAAATLAAIVSVAAAALILPAAGLILAIGLLLGGVCVPLLSAAFSRSTGGQQAVSRGAITADLVELLRGAPEIVLYGREEDRLEAIRETDRELARACPTASPRRRARRGADRARGGPDDRGGSGRRGVGTFGRSARPGAGGDRGAARACLVRRGGAAPGCGPGARRDPRRREACPRADRHAICRERPARLLQHRPKRPSASPSKASPRGTSRTGRRCSTGSTCCSSRDGASRSSARAAPGKTTVTNLLFRFLDPGRAVSRSAART